MRSFEEQPQIDPRDPEITNRSIAERAHDFREDLPTRSLVRESGGWRAFGRQAFAWLVTGFRRHGANDLAAGVAYYAMLAVVPTMLAMVSIVGVILRTEEGYRQAVSIVLWLVPDVLSAEGVQALPRLRSQSGVLGLISLGGFFWIGSTFFAALGRAVNLVYGVPDRSPLQQRLRGLIAVLAFFILFSVVIIAAILPTAVLGIDQDSLPLGLEEWPLFSALYRVVSYGGALLAAIVLFAVIFRIVANAGQLLEDVVPGATVVGTAFVLLVQVFPIYFRIVSGWNLIGGTAGLVSLVLIWFFLLGHLFLFGAYINATWQRWRQNPPPEQDDLGETVL